MSYDYFGVKEKDIENAIHLGLDRNRNTIRVYDEDHRVEKNETEQTKGAIDENKKLKEFTFKGHSSSKTL